MSPCESEREGKEEERPRLDVALINDAFCPSSFSTQGSTRSVQMTPRSVRSFLLPLGLSLGLFKPSYVHHRLGLLSQIDLILFRLRLAQAPLFFWKVTDMPLASKGHIYSLSLSAALSQFQPISSPNNVASSSKR